MFHIINGGPSKKGVRKRLPKCVEKKDVVRVCRLSSQIASSWDSRKTKFVCEVTEQEKRDDTIRWSKRIRTVLFVLSVLL
jgi:hypothetical protein